MAKIKKAETPIKKAETPIKSGDTHRHSIFLRVIGVSVLSRGNPLAASRAPR